MIRSATVHDDMAGMCAYMPRVDDAQIVGSQCAHYLVSSPYWSQARSIVMGLATRWTLQTAVKTTGPSTVPRLNE